MFKSGITLFLGMAMLAACTRHQEEMKYPVFGMEAIGDVSVMEEHSSAFVRWSEKGIRDGVLIHVSPQDALGVLSPDNARTIYEMVQKKRIAELDEGRGKLFDNSNYLTAAVQAGIIKEIYWVMPHDLFKDIPLARQKIADFLKTERRWFKESEIDNMVMTAGCLTGILSGAEMHICSPNTLPYISIPVIISMDVSFISVYAAEAGTSKLRALKWFFDVTMRKELHAIHVDISYGIEGGNTAVVHRYIGDQLIEVIRNPQVITAEKPPELWAFRDMAENMLSGGEDKLVEEYLDDPLKKYPDDPALKLLHAVVNVRLQKYDDAYAEVDEICSRDKNYCYGFLYLANSLPPDDVQWKNKFLRRAGETLPDSARVKQAVRQASDISRLK